MTDDPKKIKPSKAMKEAQKAADDAAERARRADEEAVQRAREADEEAARKLRQERQEAELRARAEDEEAVSKAKQDDEEAELKAKAAEAEAAKKVREDDDDEEDAVTAAPPVAAPKAEAPRAAEPKVAEPKVEASAPDSEVEPVKPAEKTDEETRVDTQNEVAGRELDRLEASAKADEADALPKSSALADDAETEDLVEAKPTKTEEVEETPAAHADAHHPSDEGPEPAPERDSPKMRIITTAYVAIAFAVIGVVIGTREIFVNVFRAELQAKTAPVSKQLIALRQQEEARLNDYQWVDKDTGQVRVPTKQARELVLAHYAATPIETAAPEPPAPTDTDILREPVPGEDGLEDGATPEGDKPDDGEKPKEGEAPTPPPEAPKTAQPAPPTPPAPPPGGAPKPPTQQPPAPKPPAPKPPGGDDTYQ